MSKSIKLAILGLGTVGTGVINLINDNLDELKRRSGRDIVITEVGTRRQRDDIDPNIIQNSDLMAAAASDNVDIVIEVIGGTTLAKDVIMHAIKNGKHVVTANKALLAEHGNEIFAFAEAHNVHVAYEAAVAGGIPIIKVMREGLAANKIEWLAGIINGTGNFIMTEMRDKGRPFADVLSEAQELGYLTEDKLNDYLEELFNSTLIRNFVYDHFETLRTEKARYETKRHDAIYDMNKYLSILQAGKIHPEYKDAKKQYKRYERIIIDCKWQMKRIDMLLEECNKWTAADWLHCADYNWESIELNVVRPVNEEEEW